MQQGEDDPRPGSEREAFREMVQAYAREGALSYATDDAPAHPKQRLARIMAEYDKLVAERDEARRWAQQWRDNYGSATRGNIVLFTQDMMRLPWERARGAWAHTHHWVSAVVEGERRVRCADCGMPRPLEVAQGETPSPDLAAQVADLRALAVATAREVVELARQRAAKAYGVVSAREVFDAANAIEAALAKLEGTR